MVFQIHKREASLNVRSRVSERADRLSKADQECTADG
jgi:hypothetical protein